MYAQFMKRQKVSSRISYDLPYLASVKLLQDHAQTKHTSVLSAPLK